METEDSVPVQLSQQPAVLTCPQLDESVPRPPTHFFNLLAPELFFLILAHSVYKM